MANPGQFLTLNHFYTRCALNGAFIDKNEDHLSRDGLVIVNKSLTPKLDLSVTISSIQPTKNNLTYSAERCALAKLWMCIQGRLVRC